MARSSGGGSRSSGGSGSRSSSRSSGGSRSSSSRSGGGSGITRSNTYFPGARKFRYYRNGTPHYIYSDVDLTQIQDAKPRWFLIFFYIPFIAAIIGMFGSSIHLPVKAMKTYSSNNVAIIDKSDVFSTTEEGQLTNLLKDFGETTGITTQIITLDYDEWTDNGSLSNYAYYRYYAQFEDENSWLLVYSEQDNGRGHWSWEGVQGDNTFKTMDVFLEDFNTILYSSLMVDDDPDVAAAFTKALNKSIDLFENQTISLFYDMLIPAIGMAAFVSFHGYIMIFAGTRKKYSNKELEEVRDEYGNMNSTTAIECPYCGMAYYDQGDHRCTNCGAQN